MDLKDGWIKIDFKWISSQLFMLLVISVIVKKSTPPHLQNP
jgi:hypothetical protein